MQKKMGFIFFSLVIIIVDPQPAKADILYLKNGQSLEGIISSENKKTVTLNIGSGVVSVMKNAVKSIKRYDSSQQQELLDKWSCRYFKNPENIPQRFKELVGQLEQIENQRRLALKAREDLSSLSVVINQEKDSAIRITAELDNLNEKLITLNPQANTGEYNFLIKKFNTLQASLKSHANKITILFAEKDKKGKTIFNYLNSQALFRSKFEKNSYSQLDLTDQEKKFLAVIDSRVSLLSKDFSHHSVDYNDFSNSIEIDALLNGTVKAKFIVDTGASIVLLPKSLATMLDLKPVKTSSEIIVTLADGKKVKAYLVVLETITIGDITAKNVEAAVLESGDDQTIGLLGMSFLKNFLVKIDSQNKKMILEEFEPVESRL